MTELFHHCLHITLGYEGGFVDHDADRGGATNLGITLATLIDWRTRRGEPQPKAADVARLTRAEAEEIYKVLYWEAAGCARCPPPLALVLFDAAVHHGVAGAVRMLQEALFIAGRACDPGRRDGRFGPLTAKAVAKAGELGIIDCIVRELLAQRLALMMRLCAQDRTQLAFALGWSRRIVRLQQQSWESLLEAPR